MTLGKILFSLIETIALVAWLALVPMMGYLAIVVLAVLLALEHVVSYNVFNKRPLLRLRGIPKLGFGLIAILEPVSWAGWLALIPVSQVLAVTFLFVTLSLGHIIYEMNTLPGFSPFYRFFNRFFRSLDFTIEETIVGVIWLILAQGVSPVGAVVFLFIGLLVEHLIFGTKRNRLLAERRWSGVSPISSGFYEGKRQ